MIFFSHSSRIRILQLTFALVCSCSNGLLTIEKHHLVPFCLLLFCILCLSFQINSLFFLDTQGTVPDLGEGPGGGEGLLIFRPNWRPKGQKNFVLRPPPSPPLPQDLDDVVLFISLLVYLFVYFFCLFNTSKAKMLTRVQTLQKSRQVNMKYYKETVIICTKIYNLQLIDWLTNWLADWLNDCVTDYLLVSLC